LENSTTGIYNTEGPQAKLDTAGLVHGIRAITATPSNLNWVPWGFLVEQGEVPQDTVVFWNRPSGRYLNYGRMDNTRAIDKGMKFRPLATIAQDTLAWHRTRSAEAQATLRAGLTRDRERELLRLYRDHNYKSL
jgi:2'-hydroxyisoflavone reductase